MITLNKIQIISAFEKVIVHSFEGSLYLVSMVIDGEEHYLTNKQGEPLKFRNQLEILRLFDPNKVKKAVLRQQSAYDEMVGSGARKTDNTLEVLLNFSDMV